MVRVVYFESVVNNFYRQTFFDKSNRLKQEEYLIK